ncbi:ribonuclease Z [Promineifilum sp.]|uniref:ribonuclease Z n=1 Tax=Promineifilum sp. TaxID=2664178 RepID=UPI0035B23D03
MFEVIFLGTSSSAPTVTRGLSSHIILHRHYRFLLDCGEGTQRQILRSGLGFKRLDTVLLTHGHLDHILGLGGLVSTLARWENLDHIDIYGGRFTLQRVHDLLFKVVFAGHRPPIDIALHPVEPGDVLCADDKFQLTAFGVSHRGPDNLGYLFEEKPHRPFLAERAAELGVPFGPERARLVRGEPVTLADGRLIRPEDVLGETVPGTKYVHIGDVGRTDNLLEIARGADALVMESTYLEEEATMAADFGHMTAARAATLARDAGVRHLILTHLSRRYSERDIRAEARAIFPATTVARDLDHFQITREGVVRVKKEES